MLPVKPNTGQFDLDHFYYVDFVIGGLCGLAVPSGLFLLVYLTH